LPARKSGIRSSSLIQFESNGLRIRSTRIPGQEKMDVSVQGEKEQICLSSAFLFYFGPHQIRRNPSTLVIKICTYSTNANVNLFRNNV
jgi:hypothetical protein